MKTATVEAIPSFGEYLGDASSSGARGIPAELMWGSYVGQMRNGPNIMREFEEFNLIFRGNNGMCARGCDDQSAFTMEGDFVAIPTPTTPHIRFAANMWMVDQTSEQVSHFDLRCELHENIETHKGTHSPLGFSGKCYETRPDGTTTTSDIAFWPTPPDARVLGFFVTQFSSESIGIHHTGTYPHWHGSGTDVKLVRDPAAQLGVRVGDVLRIVNGRPLPTNVSSSVVNRILKEEKRPLAGYFFRDVGKRKGNAAMMALDEGMNDRVDLTNEYRKSMNVKKLEEKSDELRSEIMGALERKKQSLMNARSRSNLHHNSQDSFSNMSDVAFA